MTTDIFATVLALLGLEPPRPEQPFDGINLLPLIFDRTMHQRPSPIGFWRYRRGSESENERWLSAERTEGTTPTTRNPGIDFITFKHPVAKTKDFSGGAAWT